MLPLLINTIKDSNTICLVIYSRFYIKESIGDEYGRLNKHVRLVKTVHGTVKMRTHSIDYYRIRICFSYSIIVERSRTMDFSYVKYVFFRVLRHKADS